MPVDDGSLTHHDSWLASCPRGPSGDVHASRESLQRNPRYPSDRTKTCKIDSAKGFKKHTQGDPVSSSVSFLAFIKPRSPGLPLPPLVPFGIRCSECSGTETQRTPKHKTQKPACARFWSSRNNRNTGQPLRTTVGQGKRRQLRSNRPSSWASGQRNEGAEANPLH